MRRIGHAADLPIPPIVVNLPRMLRRLLTGALSFFLLFMQVEDVRHALVHLGAQLQRIEHSALENPTADTCAECALLAAGSASAPVAAGPVPLVDAAPWLVLPAAPAEPAVAPPSYYRSRAPPSVLRHA
jgi:hypothetical protein